MKLDALGANGKSAGAAPARAGQQAPLSENGPGMKPDIRLMLNRSGVAAMDSSIAEIVKLGTKPSLREHVISELRAELRVRNRHAAVALGQLKAREAVAELAEATKDTGRRVDYLLRKNAIVALGEIGEQSAEALPNLLVALLDPEVRHWAAKTLSQMGKPGVAALTEALEDGRSELIAVQTLGSLGKAAESALPDLRKRTKWYLFDSELKRAAREAIKKIENATDRIDPVIC